MLHVVCLVCTKTVEKHQVVVLYAGQFIFSCCQATSVDTRKSYFLKCQSIPLKVHNFVNFYYRYFCYFPFSNFLCTFDIFYHSKSQNLETKKARLLLHSLVSTTCFMMIHFIVYLKVCTQLSVDQKISKQNYEYLGTSNSKLKPLLSLHFPPLCTLCDTKNQTKH